MQYKLHSLKKLYTQYAIQYNINKYNINYCIQNKYKTYFGMVKTLLIY